MTQHCPPLPSPAVLKSLAPHSWFYLFLHLIDTALQPRSPVTFLCSNLVSCSLPTVLCCSQPCSVPQMMLLNIKMKDLNGKKKKLAAGRGGDMSITKQYCNSFSEYAFWRRIKANFYAYRQVNKFLIYLLSRVIQGFGQLA